MPGPSGRPGHFLLRGWPSAKLRAMPVTDDVLRRAQKYDRRAMEELLAEAYASVYRMAHALTGRPGAAHTHLEADRAALSAASGAGMGVLTATLERAYQALTPPPVAIAPVARKYVRQSLRPRRLRRLFRFMLLAAVLVASYFAWRER